MDKTMILEEETYAAKMRDVVEPYLEKRCRDGYLERQKGKKIHCVRYTAAAPRGAALLSHGFTESAEKYKELIYYFLREGFHVYMPEHCGHGLSYRLVRNPSKVHVDSYRRYVLDLLFVGRLAKNENPGLPLVLYAHSMGGGIGAAVLAQEPDLFDRAVLTSPMIRPLTGRVPWGLAMAIAGVMCLTGQREFYVNGGAYDGKERFEDSCSLSPARFAWYQEKRAARRELQTNTGTYGWLWEAGRLNRYLRGTAVHKIQCPVRLFQAEREYLVSKKEQAAFIQALKDEGVDAALILVRGVKHEIFNATGPILVRYWEKVFAFLEGES